MSNTTATRYGYPQDFKQKVCEYYSNHTAPETLAHFELSFHPTMLSQWYKSLGFLPKSSSPNPNPKRVMQPKPTKQRMNFLIKKGGYILNGKFYGEAEFAKMQGNLTVGDTFTKVTVTQHKVGILNS